jgi:hypothetical protein
MNEVDRPQSSTTDPVAPEIDQAQYDHDRGPCLDAARTHTVLEVEDTRSDDRWPEFAATAATLAGSRPSCGAMPREKKWPIRSEVPRD